MNKAISITYLRNAFGVHKAMCKFKSKDYMTTYAVGPIRLSLTYNPFQEHCDNKKIMILLDERLDKEIVKNKH